MDWIFDLMGFQIKNGLLMDNGYMAYFMVSQKKKLIKFLLSSLVFYWFGLFMDIWIADQSTSATKIYLSIGCSKCSSALFYS
jgi:hypothetical protein